MGDLHVKQLGELGVNLHGFGASVLRELRNMMCF